MLNLDQDLLDLLCNNLVEIGTASMDTLGKIELIKHGIDNNMLSNEVLIYILEEIMDSAKSIDEKTNHILWKLVK